MQADFYSWPSRGHPLHSHFLRSRAPRLQREALSFRSLVLGLSEENIGMTLAPNGHHLPHRHRAISNTPSSSFRAFLFLLISLQQTPFFFPLSATTLLFVPFPTLFSLRLFLLPFFKSRFCFVSLNCNTGLVHPIHGPYQTGVFLLLSAVVYGGPGKGEQSRSLMPLTNLQWLHTQINFVTSQLGFSVSSNCLSSHSSQFSSRFCLSTAESS